MECLFSTKLLHSHDDVIKWKHFPRNWPFVREIHRSPVNSPHKGQWRGALMFSLICVWINDWVNNREAGDLRRYRAHYDVIVMNVPLDISLPIFWYKCKSLHRHPQIRDDLVIKHYKSVSLSAWQWHSMDRYMSIFPHFSAMPAPLLLIENWNWEPSFHRGKTMEVLCNLDHVSI